MKTSLILILLSLFLLIGCSDTTSPKWDADTVVQITEDGITHTFSICSNEYSTSDTLIAEYEIENNSDETVDFYFSNLNMFIIQVRNEDGEDVMRIPPFNFPAAWHITLEPGEQELSLKVWTFHDYHGDSIESGIFTLTASLDLLGEEGPSLELQTKVN